MLNVQTQALFDMLAAMQDAYPSLRRNAVAFVHENREGYVQFHGQDLVELSVTDCMADQVIYWIHMQIVDEEIYRQALDCFFQILLEGDVRQAQSGPAARHVQHGLVVCSSGISSDLFASLLEEECLACGIEARFQAAGLEEALQMDPASYSCVLAAPQICYRLESLKAHFPFCPVVPLSARDFGTLNVSRVLAGLQ